jgi:predicted esterase
MTAAPKQKTWKVYDGGHSLTPEAAKYLQGWMQKNL